MSSNRQTCILLDSPQKARQWLTSSHVQNKLIGFVPTMGALHDGHLSLIRAARNECDIVCASIFVNPLQFNNPDDLEKYPRNINSDIQLLEINGCDMVFTGSLHSFFPEVKSIAEIKCEDPGFFANGLEGDFRPGHFSGVRTIVRRLFEVTGECKAYFGEKDFQQTLVVRDLACEMGYPDIIVCPTLREANGLAMSSRNERLKPEQRKLAGKIFQSLTAAITAWEKGERQAQKLRQILLTTLDHPEIDIEYAELRDPDRWTAKPLQGELQSPPQALVAVTIGDVRLIDNTNLGNTCLADR